MKELKSYVKSLLGSAVVFSTSAAATVGSNPKLSSPTDGALMPMLLALVVIIIAIYGTAWIAKKFNLTPNNTQHLKTITSLSLGGRERIIIVEIQDQQYAIGVTPSSVNTLFKLDEKITPQSFSVQDNKLLNKLTDLLNNDPSKVKKSN